MERLIRNDFFQNPFGGGMNPMDGGSGGVLENIQQQVMDNGQALQSLQSGIGGLSTGNLPTGGIGGGFNPYEVTNDMDQLGYEAPLIDKSPPSITDAATDIESQLRAEYDELVASAKKRRDEGFMGRVVLPGENLSFEEFKKMQIKPGSPFNMLGGPVQLDIFNIAGQPEQNPGMDYSQFTPTIGNLYNDINTGAPQILDYDRPGYASTFIDQQTSDNYVPTDIFDVNGQQGFLNQASLSEPRIPTGALRGAGLDPLFGRAFAGKPI